MNSEIQADVVSEGRRVLAAARDSGLTVRLLGGVAVNVRSKSLPPALTREYKDLDFASSKKSSGDLQKLLRDLGYEPHLGFNAMNGRERLLFFDNPNERQVDVFVSSFRMCHEIPLEKRLSVDEDTVPLAELLLTKLQIIELNEKDVRDAVAILLEHEVTDDDAGVNATQFASLCCDDWGLCRTITQNLVSVREHLGRYEVDRDIVETRLDALLERVEGAPKSRSWKLRAKIGDRKRWYELPEEV
ncbi:MAG TPA: hypothetical protein VFU33_12505 [Gaiellaceae bacterium]|nr:hypothetical protein [Gaiellaceae bacterium]